MDAKDRRGFTLIELLVVVAIIALLLTILVPALNHARRQANNARVQAYISVIGTALEAFANDQGDFPTSDPWGGDPRVDPTYAPTGAHILAVALVGTREGDFPFGNKKPYLALNKAGALSDDVASEQLAPFPVVDDLGGDGCYVFRDPTYGSPIIYYRANRRAKYTPDPNYAAAWFNRRGSNSHDRAVYYIQDNGLVTGAPRDYDAVTAKPDGWVASHICNLPDEPTDFLASYNFSGYVMVDQTIPPDADGDTHLARAQNSDSFLLISAGEDGIFGPQLDGGGNPVKCDDLANFTVKRRH